MSREMPRRDVQRRLCELNRAWLALMREGRFDEAWRVSDSALRVRAGVECTQWPRHRQFTWRGAPVAGRRVLVRCYHGLGDTLQFLRFVQPLGRVARQVVLSAQPALVPLLGHADGVDTVLPLTDDGPEPDYDVDVELSELMHVLRVTPASVSDPVPYLHVGAGPRGAVDCARRVGIVWSSGNWDPKRSIPCAKLAVLGRVPGIEWLIFQRGPAAAQWGHAFGRVPPISDFVSEARAMLGLDLLITVDTCSAHLGGALGIPVWTLLRKESDWRWMTGREDTPWYPTMRLIRQASEGDWDEVLRRVGRDLRFAG